MPRLLTPRFLRQLRAAALTVLAAATAACGTSPTAPPPPTGSLKIINGDPEFPVKELYYWRCGTDDRGFNRLKQNILPQTALVVDGIEADCYKVEALWRTFLLGLFPIEYRYSSIIYVSGNKTTDVRAIRPAQ